MSMVLLRKVIMEKAAVGRWVTVRGRPVFIGGEAPSARPKAPSGEPRRKMVSFTRQDGSTVERPVYSEEWTKKSSAAKFARVATMAKNADGIESMLRHESNTGKATFKAATAGIALLMRHTGMRIGGGGTAGQPGMTDGKPTYGASTLRRKHVSIDGDKATLEYVGKSGVPHKVEIDDKDLVETFKTFMKSEGGPETPLWKAAEEPNKRQRDKVPNRRHTAARIKKLDPGFKNKDFRTLVANEHASRKVLEIIKKPPAPPKGKKGKPPTKAELKKHAKGVINEVAKHVAKKLGNTPSVALARYTHPGVIEHMLKELGL